MTIPVIPPSEGIVSEQTQDAGATQDDQSLDLGARDWIAQLRDASGYLDLNGGRYRLLDQAAGADLADLLDELLALLALASRSADAVPPETAYEPTDGNEDEDMELRAWAFGPGRMPADRRKRIRNLFRERDALRARLASAVPVPGDGGLREAVKRLPAYEDVRTGAPMLLREEVLDLASRLSSVGADTELLDWLEAQEGDVEADLRPADLPDEFEAWHSTTISWRQNGTAPALPLRDVLHAARRAALSQEARP